MVWRIWSLLAGLAPGALAGWALAGPERPAGVGVGALAGGLVFALGVWLLARRLGGAREAHLAAAAGTGWLALPALGCALLRLRPGPEWLLAGVIVAVGLALARAARRPGPAPPGSFVAPAAGSLLLGAPALLGLSGLLAELGVADPGYDEGRARAIYDLDAAVATRPLPVCSATPAGVEVLHDAGAHPRLGPEGRLVWFDAPGPEGRRQVHRLDRSTGESRCWTCGEPGHNVRPAPGNRAAGVVFDTDRHATPWDPANTEVHLVSARDPASARPSRRLTYAPGADDHAILGRATGLVIWSRFAAGGYRVVSATLRSAHGGLRLGAETVLAAGGAQWAAPLAWSPDARSLAVMRGNPYRPLSAESIDFAADRRVELAPDAAGAGSVSFSADGGRVAVASARRARLAGLLPSGLGFVLGPVAARSHASRALFRGTALRVGASWGERSELRLADVAAWGEPTGVSLAPDGDALVLAQRRENGGAVEERLLEITLDCGDGAS